MNIFVDSDVVISSLISSSGAAYLLLNKESITPYISNFSYKELSIVIERLSLDKKRLEALTNSRFKTIELKEDISEIKQNYGEYVFDSHDSHIIAGAVKAKTRYLITYNLKHFNIEKIRRDFNILIITPGMFLQYLRSK